MAQRFRRTCTKGTNTKAGERPVNSGRGLPKCKDKQKNHGKTMPRADNCNGRDVKNVSNRPGMPAAKAKRCRPGHWSNGPFRPAKQAKQHCRTACFERQNGPCGNAKRLPLASM